jgi:hypothetical protein
MDRPRKPRDEIIKELLTPYRIPPEILVEMDNGMESYRNRRFFRQRSAHAETAGTNNSWFSPHYFRPGIFQNYAGNTTESPFIKNAGNYDDSDILERLPKRTDFIVSYLFKILTWSLIILTIVFICDHYAKTASLFYGLPSLLF